MIFIDRVDWGLEQILCHKYWISGWSYAYSSLQVLYRKLSAKRIVRIKNSSFIFPNFLLRIPIAIKFASLNMLWRTDFLLCYGILDIYVLTHYYWFILLCTLHFTCQLKIKTTNISFILYSNPKEMNYSD